MGSPNHVSMPDMNVPSNLEFYRQLIELENDTSRNEITLHNLDHSQQRALQSLAHSRRFEYEYHYGCARVFRAVSDGIPNLPSFDHMPNISDDLLGLFQGLDHLSRNTDYDEPLFSAAFNTTPSDWSYYDKLDLDNEFSVESKNREQGSHISNSTFQQQLDMHDSLASISNHDVSSVDMQYRESKHQPRRLSNSSLPMFTTSGSISLPPHEDFATTMAEVPLFQDNCYPSSSAGSMASSMMSSTSLSHVTSPMQQSQSHSMVYQPESGRSTSRPGSVSSLQSDRGRNRLTKLFKKGSSPSQNRPNNRESSFDSTRALFSGRASLGQSMRTGPLDYLARVGMKAVRAVGGSCWRCRIYGKKCSADTPCDTCPRPNGSGASLWKAVGCKRGTLGREMEPVNLCSRANDDITSSMPNMVTQGFRYETGGCTCKIHRSEGVESSSQLARVKCPRCLRNALEISSALKAQKVKLCLAEASQRREEDIVNESLLGGEDITLLGPLLQTLQKNPLLKDLRSSRSASSEHYSLPSLIPLDQCILSIVWEMIDQLSCLPIISSFHGHPESSLENFTVLLRSAALYQAKLEGDTHQLIAQSLICLRQSLEIRRAKQFCLSLRDSLEDLHQTCDSGSHSCKITCISSFNSSIARYIDELSIVFFKKENLRRDSRKTWWIPVFYSLVIQSVVRKSLIEVAEHKKATSPSIQRYLHLAERLFFASSRGYDPLVQEWSVSSQPPQNGMDEMGNINAVKLSVRQKEWASRGIMTSKDYLQSLFDDDGSPIPSVANDEALEPSKPFASRKRGASSPPTDDVPSLHTISSASDFFRLRESASRSPTFAGIRSSSGSFSSVASGPRAGSLSSMNSIGQISPRDISPIGISPRWADIPESSHISSLSRSESPRGFCSGNNAQHDSSETRHPIHSSKVLDITGKTLSVPNTQGLFMCECCPKNPNKFDSQEEPDAHEQEKQYQCAHCGDRFKQKNEAECYQNSLHLRRHTWSCANLSNYAEAIYPSFTHPNEASCCGYCGREFPGSGTTEMPPLCSGPNFCSLTDRDWDVIISHLQEAHKFGECNDMKVFFRADHFRAHLKHSHAGTSGKWTNLLENACMKDVPNPQLIRGPGRIGTARVDEEDEML